MKKLLEPFVTFLGSGLDGMMARTSFRSCPFKSHVVFRTLTPRFGSYHFWMYLAINGKKGRR